MLRTATLPQRPLWSKAPGVRRATLPLWTARLNWRARTLTRLSGTGTRFLHDGLSLEISRFDGRHLGMGPRGQCIEPGPHVKARHGGGHAAGP